MSAFVGSEALQDVPVKESKPNWDQVTDNFGNMGLKPELLRGIYAYGFEQPSAIQQRAIVPIAEGHDVIAQAPPGTGKTAALSISIIQQLDVSVEGTQALVLASTCELTQQITRVVTALGDHLGIKCYACVEDTNVREDIPRLQEGFHVVVGTPGQIYDLVDRKALQTDNVKLFFLDEADEMLSRFEGRICEMLQLLPQGVQVVLFSTIMATDALSVATKFMRDPVQIRVEQDELTLEGIKQLYINVEKEEWKLDTICDYCKITIIKRTVVFCNARWTVDWLAEEMHSRGYMVSAMHEDMEQEQKEILLKEF
ncbi:P-loop containing nucleoside triphosphate hydrolase protein [Infundibulicybe gibba]|nr:P-loop containing nucleoside triphosphate hydrolase protein [Infundibulicybe gibba]